MIDLKENLSFINNKFENLSLNKHFHEEYSFSLIYDGFHQYLNENDKFTISSKMIQVVNPYEFHSTKNSSWSYLNIMSTNELINDLASHLLQDDRKKEILFHPIITDKKAISLFYDFFILMNKKEENKIEIDIAMIELFEYILTYHSYSDFEKKVNITCTKKDLNKSIEYMNYHYNDENISLENISQQIGISKYHFIKEFKKHIGITPNQYLQIKKVSKSKELLQKEVPLTHIAYECGFTDQSYMIKVFKKFYGFTPSKLNYITSK